MFFWSNAANINISDTSGHFPSGAPRVLFFTQVLHQLDLQVWPLEDALVPTQGPEPQQRHTLHSQTSTQTDSRPKRRPHRPTADRNIVHTNSRTETSSTQTNSRPKYHPHRQQNRNVVHINSRTETLSIHTLQLTQNRAVLGRGVARGAERQGLGTF